MAESAVTSFARGSQIRGRDLVMKARVFDLPLLLPIGYLPQSLRTSLR